MLEGAFGALSAVIAVAQESAAPEGVVASGWSYAIAAYVITATGLIAYAWSLANRLKKANKQEQQP